MEFPPRILGPQARHQADNSCQSNRSAEYGPLRRHVRQEMNLYLWVALGSAIGGCVRYAMGREMLPQHSGSFPWSTVLINIIGSFIIGFFGTLTVTGSRWAVPESTRIFVMVGLCGGFTTFSSFSLQTFDLLRSGAWGKALLNVGLSVVLCLGAVAVGHWIAQQSSHAVAVAQIEEEEYTG
jgi:CrcB protein